MRKPILAAAVAIAALTRPATPADAQSRSSGRKAQDRGMQEMPHCARPLGTIGMVPPEKEWWREMNLGSPEAILKVFVQESGCFTLVNRGRAMQSRAMERALAAHGELQSGSHVGRGRARAADFLLGRDIVAANANSGGGNIGGAIGGILGRRGGVLGAVGAVAGGINIKKKEANVTLSMVDTRTTEEFTTEGYARK